MDNNTIDYKKLLAEGRKFLQGEWQYTKLTALEKLTVLLSSIAVVAVVSIFIILALFFVSMALVKILTIATGQEWIANVIVAVVLLVMLGIGVLMRRALIIDPIARFLTRLFLNDKNADN